MADDDQVPEPVADDSAEDNETLVNNAEISGDDPTPDSDEPSGATEPSVSPEPPAVDWKSMARKWEKRAKDNARRAEENASAKRRLDEATAAGQTEVDRLREAISALQNENETNKLRALRADVAQRTGVPVELLSATSEEDLNDQAEAIMSFVTSRAPAAPKTASSAKPKEKLRSGAAGAKNELSREEIVAAVLGKGRRRSTATK